MGRTTGHIIDLTIENNTDGPLKTRGQTIFIRSSGKYQGYIAYIPEGIVLAPGQRKTVPIYGYCADVSKPPIPDGEAIDIVQTAIEVAHPVGLNLAVLEDPAVIENLTKGPVEDIPTARALELDVLPRFTPKMIPTINGNSDPEGELKIDDELVLTYPGTNIRIPSKIDIDKIPETAIPLLVEIVVDISHAVPIVMDDPKYPTPFDFDKLRKGRGQGQQTTWAATSPLFGKDYDEEDFQEKTYEQFENQTGVDPKSLPENQKTELDGGITAFWTSFKAVGVEAKVFAAPAETVAYVEGMEHEIDPVMQERGCSWKKICIDVYLVGQRIGDEVDLGQAKYMYQGQLRSRSVRQAASDFQLADGAVGILGNEGNAAKLRENIQSILEKVNEAYKPCCIWFELNQAYGVDPSKAKVGEDGTKLQDWVRNARFNEFGDVETVRTIVESTKRVDNQAMDFNKAAESFVSSQEELNNKCLKIFLAPGIELSGTDRGGGRAQTRGEFSFMSQLRLSPRDLGLGFAHEIGHNLGLGHVHEGVNEDNMFDVMNEIFPSEGSDLSKVKPVVRGAAGDACKKMGARATALGKDERPRPRATRRGPSSGIPDGGLVGEEPAHDPGRQAAPPGEKDEEKIQDQEEDEEDKCVCPDPEIKVDGLNDLLRCGHMVILEK